MPDYDMKLDRGLWGQVVRVLNELPTNVENQIVRPASSKAYKPIVQAAKAILGSRRRTGLLRKSIGLVQRTRRGTVYTIVGPRTGFKDPETGENPVNIAHLVELGTKPHEIAPRQQSGVLAVKSPGGPTSYVSGAVQHPGAEAKPFIRPAWDAQRGQIMPTLEREMAAKIMQKAAKYANRAPK